MSWHHPILSCTDSKRFEDQLFDGDSAKAALAMEKAGTALAEQLLMDLGVRLQGKSIRCLLLVGKGHNSGDALIAVSTLFECLPGLTVELLPVFGVEHMSAAVQPWWNIICQHDRVELIDQKALFSGDCEIESNYDLSIDGIFGMQFRSPLSDQLVSLFRKIDQLNIDIRVAVDLPSGLNDSTNDAVLRADFTYATGIVKTPLIKPENLGLVGRVRYLDIGFFEKEYSPEDFDFRVVHHGIFDADKRIRPIACDKRSYGHLLIVGGSTTMPGALLMAVKAAIRSGVGLLTVVCPLSVSAQFAAVVPEAMWIPWEENLEGGLALEGLNLLQQFQKRITAVLLGPGCGQQAETQALLDEIIELFDVPVILDADALTFQRMERLKTINRPIVMTPHEGEFRRISGMGREDFLKIENLRRFAGVFSEAIVVLKGPLTKMSNGESVVLSPFGNPILARGGSGDLLSGLIAGKVAVGGKKCFYESVARGVATHGNAADRLFSEKEETHIQTTDILNFLNLY